MFVTLLLTLLASTAHHPPAPGLILAGERVTFSENEPRFTQRQLETTAASTRAGLAAWLKTSEGREWIGRWESGLYEVTVAETATGESLGEALPPAFATLITLNDPAEVKRFQIALNPAVASRYDPRDRRIKTLSARELMAAAWAGEMLHVSFYAAGINLPHHDLSEFQRRWTLVAEELGLEGVPHGDE